MFDFLNPVNAAVSGPLFADIRLAVMVVIGLAVLVCGLRWILSALGYREAVERRDDD